MFKEIIGMIDKINTDNIIPVLLMATIGIAILSSLLAKLKDLVRKVLRIIAVISVITVLYGAKQGLLWKWFTQLTSIFPVIG